MSSSDFAWPVQYSFPPFFTIQPNAETKKKQLDIWTQLVLNYCRANKMFVLDKSDNSSVLFNNREISRQLSLESITVILEYMKTKEKIQWADEKKDRCFVFWHSPAEWGTILFKYAQKNGLANSVETFFQLTNSSAEFSGMDVRMLKICLRTLEDQGKAEIIGDDGVKFFS